MYVFCFLNKVLSKYLTHDSSNPILKETFAMLKKWRLKNMALWSACPSMWDFENIPSGGTDDDMAILLSFR